MADIEKQIEAELSEMQPYSMPDGLAARIEAELAAAEHRVSPWPDRFLLAAIGSGALAACVLVAVVFAGISGSDGSAGPSRMVSFAPNSMHSSATLLAFAPGNPDWVDVLK